MMPLASLGFRHELHMTGRILHGLWERRCSHHLPVIRIQSTTCRRQNSHLSLRSNSRSLVNTRGFKFISKFGACDFKISPRSSKGLLPICTHAFDNFGRANKTSGQDVGRRDKGFIQTLLHRLARVLGGLFLAAFLMAAALPSLLSWAPLRSRAISLANQSIPGTLSISSMSLGWTRPVHMEGFSLQGIDGENVLSILKVDTKAPLWSIVLGKSGLGDCTVTSPVINLQQHPKSNLPRLSLAMISAEKLLEKSSLRKKSGKQVVLPPAEASLVVEVKAPKGGLQVTNGKIIFPSDVGAVLGPRLIINVDMGPWATKESDELKHNEANNVGVPVLTKLWSESVQAEAAGFLQEKYGKFKLVKPLQVEMDLTPAVAKVYLARVNPILGEIVGPAIKEEDMPDVIMQITPYNLVLPADHYKVNIAPMKVTLARGQVVDGVLSLLSKQEVAKGSKNLTMQTSAIEAKVDMPSSVESLRLDILIADRVHVATWGHLDWINETVQMTLAIPGKSLRELLGLSRVPANYYLKVPISGTLEKPKVDWKTAGVGIATLTARQQGGMFMQDIFDIFDSNEKSKLDTPEPIDTLPWESHPTSGKTGSI